MKKLSLIVVAMLATLFLSAQKQDDKYLKSNPVWIQMMSDTVVNYFDAKHAFEVYELMVASDKDNGSSISGKKRKSTEAKLYAFEYKKFKHWLIRNEPFVKDDGYLMTPDERIKQWQIQMLNRK